MSKTVCCTQRDALTGLNHHFVLQKNKNRGAWVSSLAIDLSAFMVHRSECSEKRQQAFGKKVREKALEEAKAREAARVQAAAAEAARTQALMREQASARAKAAKEQAEAKAKFLREKAEAKAAAKAAKVAAKEKERAEKAAAKAKIKAEKDAAREAAKQASRARNVQLLSHPHAQSVCGTTPDIASVLNEHKIATQRLIRESSKAGLSFVPEADIKKLRMKAASELQKCYRGTQMSSNILFSQLGKAESEALKAETEAKKMATDSRLQEQSRAGQNFSHQQASQSSQPWTQSMQNIARLSQTSAPLHRPSIFPPQNALIPSSNMNPNQHAVANVAATQINQQSAPAALASRTIFSQYAPHYNETRSDGFQPHQAQTSSSSVDHSRQSTRGSIASYNFSGQAHQFQSTQSGHPNNVFRALRGKLVVFLVRAVCHGLFLLTTFFFPR